MENRLETLLRKLAALEIESRMAEEAYAAEPENAAAEAAFDIAYGKEYKALNECAEVIVAMTNGTVQRHVAREMVRLRRKEITRLVRRYTDVPVQIARR